MRRNKKSFIELFYKEVKILMICITYIRTKEVWELSDIVRLNLIWLLSTYVEKRMLHTFVTRWAIRSLKSWNCETLLSTPLGVQIYICIFGTNFEPNLGQTVGSEGPKPAKNSIKIIKNFLLLWFCCFKISKCLLAFFYLIYYAHSCVFKALSGDIFISIWNFLKKSENFFRNFLEII